MGPDACAKVGLAGQILMVVWNGPRLPPGAL